MYLYKILIYFFFYIYLNDIINIPKIINIHHKISYFSISNLLYIIQYNNNNTIYNHKPSLTIALL